ncbi:DUF1636 family protein [Burkholderia singularis]|nr:DUF1636 family protein [Burkholderia singularis]
MCTVSEQRTQTVDRPGEPPTARLLAETFAICRTCPRNRPGSGAFAHALYRAMKDALCGQGIEVRLVHCLGSCVDPCAVALDSPVKPRLRLSGLTESMTGDLVDAALAYRSADAGHVGASMLPVALKSNISAISPKNRLRTDAARGLDRLSTDFRIGQRIIKECE